MEKLERDIQVFKVLLIILTIFQITVLIMGFFESQLLLNLERDYYLTTILGFYALTLTGVFIWYNWNKLPIERKKKVSNTWMLSILGIMGFGVIGLWIWLPNKREIKKFSQLPTSASAASSTTSRESATTGESTS
jgi:hypothetical protein